MNKRGYVISKIYEDITKTETKDYVVENYNLNINFNFENGIIHFDERKSHIVNCRQLLNNYYDLKKDFSYDDTEFLKKKINNLDGHEIYLANMLAAIGEITILYGDYIENDETITSTMLFLPSDMKLLTPNQILKIENIISLREENFFGAALCDGNVNNITFFEKNEAYEILNNAKTKIGRLS